MKTCGNCDNDRTKCTEHEQKYGCDGWQPKPAEPQGWEERFRQAHHKGLAECQIRSIIAFIRQVAAEEREKGRQEFAPLTAAIEMAFKEADFLPDSRLTHKARAVFEPIRQALAEQNRRGGEK